MLSEWHHGSTKTGSSRTERFGPGPRSKLDRHKIEISERTGPGSTQNLKPRTRPDLETNKCLIRTIQRHLVFPNTIPVIDTTEFFSQEGMLVDQPGLRG